MNDSTGQQLSKMQLLASLLVAALIGIGITYFIIIPAEQHLAPVPGNTSEEAGQVPAGDEELVKTPEIVETGDSNADDVLYIAIVPQSTGAIVNEFGEPQPVLDGVNIRQHEKIYKSEVVEITIAVGEELEYKALMQQGEVLLYDWKANGEVYYDFHAHQDTGDPNFFTRYTAGEGKADSGSIVALYQGQHGWYWLNISEEPLKLTLSVAGYYDEIIEIDLKEEQ